MDVIKPIVITAGMLTSSTVLEPDAATGEVAWSGSEYTVLGDQRALTSAHKLYQRTSGTGRRLSIVSEVGSGPVYNFVALNHGIPDDTPVVFNSSPPTGATAGVTYYTRPPTGVLALHRLSLSTTIGGAPGNFGTNGATYSMLIGGLLTAASPDVDTTNWTEIGPTNRWKAMDSVVSTQAIRASSLQYVFTPGVVVQAVAVFGIVGSSIRCQVHNGATQLYDQTINLDSTTLAGWQSYLFGQTDNIREAVFSALPTGSGYKQTITINRSSGNAAVGEIVLGSASYTIGKLTYGVGAGITDYSNVTENFAGVATFVKRGNSKILKGQLLLTTAEINRVYRLLSDLSGVPCVWVGVADANYSAPLTVYGWFKGFNVEIPYPSHSLCSLEIKGIV
jgi:hypothetical protein